MRAFIRHQNFRRLILPFFRQHLVPLKRLRDPLSGMIDHFRVDGGYRPLEPFMLHRIRNGHEDLSKAATYSRNGTPCERHLVGKLSKIPLSESLMAIFNCYPWEGIRLPAWSILL